ncbi:hypothetical protein DRJ54_01060 [Candidatus Acetothermia bacterium]|nr:MAG: hypothetical protein DRJ54_01060 [Candidatus Acetothermia bacterium]
MRWACGGLVLALAGLILWGSFAWGPRPLAPSPAQVTAGYGVRNAVAAVVLGARLWDTLLEVLVFAVAMAGVRFGLSPLPRAGKPTPLPESHLLARMGDVLFAPVAVFSLYLALSGHLGPGGGFPAGAILGSGLLLLALAMGMEPLSRRLHEGTLERLEYGTVAALLGAGVGMGLAGRWGPGWFVAVNLAIALEVAIGAWVVLHRFAAHRGEL